MTTCKCFKALISTGNPNDDVEEFQAHTCEDGQIHHCKSCFEVVLSWLSAPNTRIEELPPMDGSTKNGDDRKSLSSQQAILILIALYMPLWEAIISLGLACLRGMWWTLYPI